MSGLVPPNPLSYNGQVVVPYINRTFPPNSGFNDFNVPTVWVDTQGQDAYVLVSKPLGVANWVPIGGIPGELQTLTGNTGGAISPTGNNINTVGTGSITIGGSGSTLTTQLTGLTLNAIQVGAGTATLTQLGPVNRAVLTSGATGVPAMTALALDGQLIIGSTAGAPAAATLTPGTGITITNASNSITINSTASGSSLSPYIVGTTGSNDFTDIQEAIDQAVLDGASVTDQKNIYIKPGTYNENIIIYDGINLLGMDETFDVSNGITPFQDFDTLSAIVTGSFTFTGTETSQCKIKGLDIRCDTNATFMTFTHDVAFCFIQNCRIVLDGSNSILVGYNFIASIFFDNCHVSNGQGKAFDVDAGITAQFYSNNSVINCPVPSIVSAGSIPLIKAANSIWIGNMDFTATAEEVSIDFFNTTFVGPTSGAIIDATGNGSGGTYQFQYCNIQAFQELAFVGDNPTLSFTFQQCTGTLGCSSEMANYKSMCGTNTYSSVITKTNYNSFTAPFFNGSEYQVTQGGIQTTDDTPINVVGGVLLNENEAVIVDGIVVGSLADHTLAVAGTFSYAARRASGGNITAIGAGGTATPVSDTGATFDVVADIGTQSIVIEVTGVAAATYNWVCTYRYQKILTDD